MSSSPAPWKERIENTLAENMKKGSKDSLNVQFATNPAPGAPKRPSVRTVVYRGFVGQPRKDDEWTAGNPSEGVKSNLMLVSTDTRMLKAKQLQAQQSRGDSENGFEICWWHQGTQEQFRIAGQAWLLGPSDSNDSTALSSFPGHRLKSQITLSDEQKASWTWENERRRIFNKHSPGLRGSFVAPDPGSPATPEKTEKTKNLPELPGRVEDAKDDEERKSVETALSRFGLIVLEIEYVEYLKVDPPPARTAWYLNKEDGSWTTQDISP